jgi:hypothetical protein
MEILVKLFGSDVRVKLLRMFLFHDAEIITVADIAARIKVKPVELKKELAMLMSIRLIKQKVAVKDVDVGRGKKQHTKRVKIKGYAIDTQFSYFTALKNLLITASLHSEQDITRRFAKAGKIKLLLVAGVFIQDWNSRVDLFIVGDELNEERIKAGVQALETELGKELSYSVLSTEEFEYRLGVYDKLVRDILDFPHTKIINRFSTVL